MGNITLIGMVGAGKSTLGKLLADKLGYEFIDSDKMIQSSGGELQGIIDSRGDEGFLQIEEDTLLSLKGNKKVFAPGGSCVFSQKGMNHLKKISCVIFIDVPFKIIEKRLKNMNVNTKGIVWLKKMTLKRLFDIRKPLYEKYADIIVKLNSDSIADNFNKLIKEIK